MSARKAIIGLCALCALLVSAFAAQGASAAGTTAYTCSETGTQVGVEKFSDAHCKTPNSPSGGPFRHVAFTGETAITATNGLTGAETESTKLKSTLGGAAVTLTGTAVASFEGKLNNKDEGGEMFVHITGRLHFTNVTVNKSGCKVFAENGGVKGAEGTVTTEPLTATTKGQGDAALIQPATGEVIASFIIEGCENAAINGKSKILGKVKTTSIEGATANFTHANTTAQETLGANSLFNPAGIEGSLTIKGPEMCGAATTPISVTT